MCIKYVLLNNPYNNYILPEKLTRRGNNYRGKVTDFRYNPISLIFNNFFCREENSLDATKVRHFPSKRRLPCYGYWFYVFHENMMKWLRKTKKFQIWCLCCSCPAWVYVACLRNRTTLRFDFLHSFIVCAQTYAFWYTESLNFQLRMRINTKPNVKQKWSKTAEKWHFWWLFTRLPLY